MPLYRLPEIQRRILDLVGLSFKMVRAIPRWFSEDLGREVELPFASRAHPDRVFRFSAEVDLEAVDGAVWVLKISMSGGGLLRVDGLVAQGIDPGHSFAFIGEGRHKVSVEATPRALFGEAPWGFLFDHAVAAAANWSGISLAIGMLEALRLARRSEDPLRRDLLELLSRSLSRVDMVPTVSQVAAAEAVLGGHGDIEGRWDRRYIATVYGSPVLLGIYRDVEDPRVGEADRAIEEARRSFEEGLGELVKKHPKQGSLIVFGHCHIDAAWLWPYSETLRKIQRSFANVLAILERGHRISFAQSSAQYYSWLERCCGELFERVRREVERGSWIPVGGMWVEPDTNLVTGESLARQLLLGQRYFLERFSRIARIGWIPDSFGFSAQLPQIMSKAGIEVFVTHKVMWNDTNKFPHTLFLWEGLDGTRIPVHVMPITYNGTATVEEILRAWEAHVEKSQGPGIHAVGVGDGGGGPSVVMAERLFWINRLPGAPRVEHNLKEEDYLDTVKRASPGLPLWRGELYVEIHRGTYTTNHRIKELVSRLERCLRSSEIWGSIAWAEGASEYPDTRRAWEALLRNQFHDVLPGSASWEAYQEAYEDLEEALGMCEDAVRRSLEALAGSRGPGAYVYVFNDLPWARRALVSLPRGSYRALGSKILGAQSLGEVQILELEMPGMGYTLLERVSEDPQPSEGPVRILETPEGILVGNDLVEALLRPDGSLSLRDRELGWEALGGGGLVLKAHQDKPGEWDAWDVERSSAEDPGIPLEPAGRPRAALGGPLIGCAEIPLRFKGSEVLERVCVRGGSRLLEISLKIRWSSRGYLLKLWARPSIGFEEVACEIPYGVVKRPSRPRSSWDEAKFEFPALRWVDASDGRRGVAIISATRHGYSVRGGSVGLTIAKNPLFPDPYTGSEPFETKIYIYPHRGDYVEGLVHRAALEAWSPPETVQSHRSPDKPERVFISLEGRGAVLEALKRSEDGEALVARICEISGAEGTAEITTWRAFRAEEADLLERPLGIPAGSGQSLRIPLKPFEVKTLVLKKI